MSEESLEQAKEFAILKKKKEHIQQQLNVFRPVWWVFLLAFLLGAIFTTCSKIVLRPDFKPTSSNVTILSLLGGLLGILFYLYFVGAFWYLLSRSLRRIELDIIKFGSEELQERLTENFFTNLVQINFKYLDQYYLQTQEQADKSFRLSSGAAIAGLTIVLLGIVMMYYDKIQPAYVTTGAGIISEFIAAVFFYLYNKTILKMSQYHQKLVITQNISLALRITDDMDNDSKNKALALLVDRLTFDVNKYLSFSTNRDEDIPAV